MPNPFGRAAPIVLNLLGILAFIAGLSVLGARWNSARIAAHTAPGTAETSGCEEETWFVLWNQLNDKPVFRTATESPFNFAYFNSGFYRVYGAVLGLVEAKNTPSRIITVGRLLTAILGLIGAALWFAVGRQILGPTQIGGLLAWSSFPLLGPITGWMFVSVRPDVGAVACEAAALASFIILRPRHRWLSLLVAGAAGYTAWSFKISFVGALCTIGCFLIWRREWRNLITFCLPVFAAMGATLWLGGETYRHALFGASFGQSPFFAANGIAAFKHFVPAASPLLSGIAIALLWPRSRQSRGYDSSTTNDAIMLGAIGSVGVTTMMGVAACKTGSWTYYYMPAMLPLALFGIAMAHRRGVVPVAAATVSILALVLQGGLLFGAWGRVSLASNAAELAERWSVFSKLPEPRFSSDLRLNLPWLNPNSLPLIPAYDYTTLRGTNAVFEGDGVGGMIRRSEIRSLLLPRSTDDKYDGASLVQFAREDTLDNWSTFVSPLPVP